VLVQGSARVAAPFDVSYNGTTDVFRCEGAVVRINPIRRAKPVDQVLDRIPEHPRHRRVHVAIQVFLDKVDAAERRFGQYAESLVYLAQCQSSQIPLQHVAELQEELEMKLAILIPLNVASAHGSEYMAVGLRDRDA